MSDEGNLQNDNRFRDTSWEDCAVTVANSIIFGQMPSVTNG